MKKICFIICILLSNICYGQEALEKGQPAPEDGIFLTKEEAAKVLAEKQAAEKICKINLDASLESQKTKCDYEKGLLQNELSYEKKKQKEINNIRDVQDEKLYDRIADSGDDLYWFMGGLVLGSAVVGSAAVGVVVIINQVLP